MKAINFVKTNYKYCVLGEKEHKEYPLPSDSFYNQNTDYLGEPTSKSDGEIEKNISMNTSFNDILDVDSHLDLRTMIIYSLPSFGKMSSIVMLK